MSRVEKLMLLYNRDFPADATEENNPEYKKFLGDVMLVFPLLVNVVKTAENAAYCTVPVFQGNDCCVDCQACSGCVLQRALNALEGEG